MQSYKGQNPYHPTSTLRRPPHLLSVLMTALLGSSAQDATKPSDAGTWLQAYACTRSMSHRLASSDLGQMPIATSHAPRPKSPTKTWGRPQGPSTPYLWFLTPTTIHGMVFGNRNLKNVAYLDPLEGRKAMVLLRLDLPLRALRQDICSAHSTSGCNRKPWAPLPGPPKYPKSWPVDPEDVGIQAMAWALWRSNTKLQNTLQKNTIHQITTRDDMRRYETI